jgi:hypothetical protein
VSNNTTANFGFAQCLDTQTSVHACGACDRSCFFGESCQGGTCVGGAGVGTARLTPAAAQTKRGHSIRLALSWTVPEPRVWTDLASLELRLRDGDSTILSVVWYEASNLLRLVDPLTSTQGPAATPSSRALLRTRRAKLLLAGSTVTGSGTGGREVTVAVTLALRPPRHTRTYVVDAVAVSDAGTEQVASSVGTLRVRRR